MGGSKAAETQQPDMSEDESFRKMYLSLFKKLNAEAMRLERLIDARGAPQDSPLYGALWALLWATSSTTIEPSYKFDDDAKTAAAIKNGWSIRS